MVIEGELERDFIFPPICVTENRDTQSKSSLWMQDVTVRLVALLVFVQAWSCHN